IDWALQYPLNFEPGAATYSYLVSIDPPRFERVVPGPKNTYSNFGYLILGEILQELAPGGYLGYVHDQVMSPQAWVPENDWGPAHSLQTALDPREPGYVTDEGKADNVFDYPRPPGPDQPPPPPERVDLQYGG